MNDDAARPALPGEDPVTGRKDKLERFIPVARTALEERLKAAHGWSGADAETWHTFFHRLAAFRHQDYRGRLARLKQHYLPFSPDRDTVSLLDYDAEAQARMQRAFVKEIAALLERANYHRIDAAELERLLRERSPYGLSLNVDLSEYDEVLLYARGSAVETRTFRDPWRAYLVKRSYEVPIFKRLFLLVKLKPVEARVREVMQADNVSENKARKKVEQAREHLPSEAAAEHIYLKLFKRIPHIDLEMLFPNTKVTFKLFDKLKLGVTAGGGAVASIVGTATKIAATTNPFTLVFALAGLGGVVVRQVTSFFNTRNRYFMELARNLYFHNLANNRAVLTLLGDRGEGEDIKEDILLYVFLSETPVNEDGLPDLKRRIEAFLDEHCGVNVDFDLRDVLARLTQDGLVSGEDGTYAVAPPAQASEELCTRWQEVMGDIEKPVADADAEDEV